MTFLPEPEIAADAWDKVRPTYSVRFYSASGEHLAHYKKGWYPSEKAFVSSFAAKLVEYEDVKSISFEKTDEFFNGHGCKHVKVVIESNDPRRAAFILGGGEPSSSQPTR